jgi:hypothetical protein
MTITVPLWLWLIAEAGGSAVCGVLAVFAIQDWLELRRLRKDQPWIRVPRR